MVKNRDACYRCDITVTRLIKEYVVKACSNNDKNYFIGKFVACLPNCSNKKSSKNQWTLPKEGLLGRQVTDTLREEYKNEAWMLEGEMRQSKYHGQPEELSTFIAIPAGFWYNFNKVAQCKQLSLEEAEEKMKNRRRNVDGYERWMMKAAKNGPAAFGESNEVVDIETGRSSRGGCKKSAEDEEGNASDKKGVVDDEDEDEEEMIGSTRKFSLMMMKLLGMIVTNEKTWLQRF